MDSLDLCNAIRMEFGGILEDKIPLNAFPAKIWHWHDKRIIPLNI